MKNLARFVNSLLFFMLAASGVYYLKNYNGDFREALGYPIAFVGFVRLYQNMK